MVAITVYASEKISVLTLLLWRRNTLPFSQKHLSLTCPWRKYVPAPSCDHSRCSPSPPAPTPRREKTPFALFKVTIGNLEVFLKPSNDSSHDFKFAVSANETLSENTDIFMSLLLTLVIRSESPQTQKKQVLFFVFFKYFVFLCNDILLYYILCPWLLVCSSACNVNADVCVTSAYRKQS